MRFAAVFALSLACGFAQETAPKLPQESTQLKDARHRLGLIATRAIAEFDSMDVLQDNLASIGVEVASDLVSLRTHIEESLDGADLALEKKDAKAASEALDRAEAYLNRLAARLGG